MTGGARAAAPSDVLGVLVVDDTPDVRAALRVVLSSDDRFRVLDEAVDGLDALDKAARLQPDLVLLDLAMPRLDGMAALPRIRRAAPAARVVILSAADRSEAEPRARDLGAVGYLEKGTPPDRLLDELHTLATALGVVEEAVAEARARVAAEARSAGSARRFVESTLADWGCPSPLEVVKLLVSELVTNAVRHAHSEAEVVVRLTRHRVRIEVADASPVMPVRRHAAPQDTSGRGIALVDTFAAAWGAYRTGEGKVVWFEVPRSGVAA